MPRRRAIPNKRPLLDKKEEIENAIDKLKYEKAAMNAAEYKKQLTALLLRTRQTSGGARKVTHGKVLRLGAAGLLVAFAAAAAQTLQQAESLWKARRYVDANEVFKALEAKIPNDPDYQGALGPHDAGNAPGGRRADLFNEALEMKKDHARPCSAWR